MGELIHLRQRRGAHVRPAEGPPVFFFDVSCPLSYLTAESVERRLGAAEWVPVGGAALRALAQGAALAHLRGRADVRARALRLPLVWPERFPAPAPAPRALRASAFACEVGAGAAFALAASRLAFCGGFDLEDPETLAEAAAAAGVPLDGCLAAAGETWRDDELAATARALARHGIDELPAIRIGRRWIGGEGALPAAFALRRARQPVSRPMAPSA
jgi:2-hydroxychromene-2-carboxylate isomerase